MVILFLGGLFGSLPSVSGKSTGLHVLFLILPLTHGFLKPPSLAPSLTPFSFLNPLLYPSLLPSFCPLPPSLSLSPSLPPSLQACVAAIVVIALKALIFQVRDIRKYYLLSLSDMVSLASYKVAQEHVWRREGVVLKLLCSQNMCKNKLFIFILCIFI